MSYFFLTSIYESDIDKIAILSYNIFNIKVIKWEDMKMTNKMIRRSSYNTLTGYTASGEKTEVCISVYKEDIEYRNLMNKDIPGLSVFAESNEFKIGDPITVSEYEDVLAACIRMRLLSRGYNNTVVESKVKSASNWLASTDFYESPASTRYHEAYAGGLVNHTVNVYNQICDLWKLNKFKDVDIYSAAFVALVHDWCKIGLYSSYQKNVKEDGTWKQVTAYMRDTPTYPFGHGETSMLLADRFGAPTIEESLAIRWHMGKWYCPDVLDNHLQTANEKYPLVHMLQFADQLSIVSY